ncbi:hypothetical protein HK098_007002, partial [Nowakowskiella sp. JEL0407]
MVERVRGLETDRRLRTVFMVWKKQTELKLGFEGLWKVEKLKVAWRGWKRRFESRLRVAEMEEEARIKYSKWLLKSGFVKWIGRYRDFMKQSTLANAITAQTQTRKYFQKWRNGFLRDLKIQRIAIGISRNVIIGKWFLKWRLSLILNRHKTGELLSSYLQKRRDGLISLVLSRWNEFTKYQKSNYEKGNDLVQHFNHMMKVKLFKMWRQKYTDIFRMNKLASFNYSSKLNRKTVQSWKQKAGKEPLATQQYNHADAPQPTPQVSIGVGAAEQVAVNQILERRFLDWRLASRERILNQKADKKYRNDLKVLVWTHWRQRFQIRFDYKLAIKFEIRRRFVDCFDAWRDKVLKSKLRKGVILNSEIERLAGLETIMNM